MNTSPEKTAANIIDRIMSKLTPRDQLALKNYITSMTERRTLAATIASGMLISKYKKEELPNIAKLSVACANEIIEATIDEL